MAHPEDNTALDQIRLHEYEKGRRDEKAAFEGALTNLTNELNASRAETEAAAKKFRDHMAQPAPAGHVSLPPKPQPPDSNPTPAPEPAPAPSPTPTPAGGIRDLVAVRVFPHYAGKNYAEHDKVLALLGDLGIKRVSGLLGPGTLTQLNGFYKKAYERYGIKCWFTVGEPRKVLTASQWDSMQNAFSTNKSFIELVSGWNEPNHVRGSGSLPANWPELTIAHNKKLFEIARPLGIDVGTAQLWSGKFPQHEADLKKIAAGMKQYSTDTSWHLYPRGGVGADLVKQFYGLYEAQIGKRQVCCTESGYFTIDPSKNDTGAVPVTEAQQAQYLPQHIKLYTDRGDRFSYFELLDDASGGREGTLGLVRADWSKKPAFAALKQLLAA